MSVLAFLYEDYENNGIENCCRGIWKDEEDALFHIKGSRYGLKNLRLFNLETHSWKEYKWEPTYILREGEWIYHPWNKSEKITRKFLRYRWGYKGDKVEEIEILPPSNYKASRFGPEHDALYDAGSWSLVRK